MTKEAVYVALNKIFSDIFDEPITLFPETTAKDIDGWDSLEHINIIHSVERRFGMKFKMGEISTMKCVGEMVDIILARATKG
ncbi:MAG: acyl carrier protein [Clostridia bacterium]|nr:acyl carrier protein [Clostridia bacterium]MBQ4297151.1 acyl carrier protein [Clostridia bacterium]